MQSITIKENRGKCSFYLIMMYKKVEVNQREAWYFTNFVDKILYSDELYMNPRLIV